MTLFGFMSYTAFAPYDYSYTCNNFRGNKLLRMENTNHV